MNITESLPSLNDRLQTLNPDQAVALAVELVSARPSSVRHIWEDMKDAILAVLLLDELVSSEQLPHTSPVSPDTDLSGS